MQDLDRIIFRRLMHIDLLEAADQGAVLLEVIPVFLVGGRTDAAHRALANAGFSKFEASIEPPEVAPAPITVWISSMKRIAPGMFFNSVEHILEPLLEIAAVARAGQQRAHIEREDHRDAPALPVLRL